MTAGAYQFADGDELNRCLALCASALTLPDDEIAPALGRVVAELMAAPLGCYRRQSDAAFEAPWVLAADAEHDGRSYGQVLVAARDLPYDDEDRHRLETIARLVGWLVHARDDRDAALREALLAEDELRLHARIFELSDEGVMITDGAGQIIAANPMLCQITGYARDELLGQPQAMFRCTRHESSFYAGIVHALRQQGRWQGELWTRRKDGEIFPLAISIGAVRDHDGAISHFFSICTDITERKRTEGRIHHMAFYDALTGLPNRVLFNRLLEQSLLEARRNGFHGAVLFIDLNRFKPINDTLGHEVGDRVLQEVANRLRGALRGADVVARLGGDEFVVGLFDIAAQDHAAIVAQKLQDALQPPILVNESELVVGAAIGISLYPRDGEDTDTLLRLADIAMYRAKQASGDTHKFYDPEMNQKAVERLGLEAALRRAVERDELLLYFQPKVRLGDGRIAGAEALVRWRHADRGMVSPGEFIPLAEETGLIAAISAWVLEEACAQARRWQDGGMTPLRIAVNLSARDFAPELPQRVADLLAKHGIGPEWIELEITEGMLMNQTERVIEMMRTLKGMGLTLALDDFGTGYSSLSYLKRFPIHALKIDRSFVINIPDDRDDCAIAGAIVGMASQLGHKVIAEGVETEAQVTFLRQHFCDEIQGYFFSPPVPAAAFADMIQSGKQLS